MPGSRFDSNSIARRKFLHSLTWAPALFLPAPLRGPVFATPPRWLPSLPFDDNHVSPTYPSPSPLEEVLRLVIPGRDQFIWEQHAADLQQILNRWAAQLLTSHRDLHALAPELHPDISSNLSAAPVETKRVAKFGYGIRQRKFPAASQSGAAKFLDTWTSQLSSYEKINALTFEITRLAPSSSQPASLDTDIRYTVGGSNSGGSRDERIALCQVRWSKSKTNSTSWIAEQWQVTEELVAQANRPLFLDVTHPFLASCASYNSQLSYGSDYWRTVLDGACGIDVYGNNGIAAGDFDNDGFDDLYVCQPSGMPNRLYRNRGDGTFEDATAKSGVGVLDATSCALFADFENRGLQDLLVVCDSGPLLFLNQGNGKFEHKPGAFSFAKPPLGTFTHAALADYDRDGRLDVYFCLYTYYLGLDQYHYPSPYFDARNGPSNFLFHNEGNWNFVDRTAASRLNAENDRYSFACAWGDANGDGAPDLYVANDFGRSNLYRTNGDGTFTAASDQSGANDAGAGMSACWLDAENGGNQDIYVSNMWSAAGQRISDQRPFHPDDPPNIKSLYRQHARGNSFYKNLGNGHFENAAARAGLEVGRWAWSSDSWDFDHDGFVDIYVTNGYVSGTAPQELSSFFWRQVVGNSPSTATPSPAYEHGWNAINELIRSDHTWNGFERNVLYANNGDGTFSDVSGVSGLDFLDDSRSFALADLNHDGRLEIILKNRSGPQLRILQNAMADLGDSVSFRLRGTQSNRDAIGARITVTIGNLRQAKYVQAGTGFLSRHSKELFFGLGKSSEPLKVAIRWPNGSTQSFQNVPRNHRIDVTEGNPTIAAKPFASYIAPPANLPATPNQKKLPDSVAAWLLEPLPSLDFALGDSANKTVSLSSLLGKPVLLYFWTAEDPSHVDRLRSLDRVAAQPTGRSPRILAVNLDTNFNVQRLRVLASQEKFSFPLLQGTPEIAGVYNIIYRYLFDRRRDIPLPTAFLLDESGNMVKIYQGKFDPAQLLIDVQNIPRTYEARIAQALPFPSKLYNGRFQRNDFTYGIALFQHGFLDHAASSFKQVIAAKPENAEAHYNLGTLYLRKNDASQARTYLEKAVTLQPDYPEAWNNLGMIAVQQNRVDEAQQNFRRSLSQRPDYVTALLNLGSLLRRQGDMDESAKLLSRAIELEPQNPEANYNLGMLYARQNDFARAESLLQKAATLRPNYADALNNLGVLFVRDGRTEAAEQQFQACISAAPNFDQAYLNLARLYAVSNQNDKARAVLESLLKLQPGHKLARQSLEMLH